MENKVTIEFCTAEQPLIFSSKSYYVVEELIIESCKHLNIGPLARHLFGLWCQSKGVWLPPSMRINLSNDKTWVLRLKVRFKVPSIKRLVEKTDSKTFSYYFHQVRADFLEGKIPELLEKDLRENAFGLVATDIIRLMLELKSTPDTMKYHTRDFIPIGLQKSKLIDNFLHKNLQKAVNRGWKYSRQNPEFVKEKYLQQLTELVPDYGSEAYSVLIDDFGKIYEVSLVVSPFHPEYPGLRMKVEKSKNTWTHICAIEELCYISMRNDETVEISRQNGVPQYLKFHNNRQMHSFVSLLDGYYRLTEKWTFNLCKDLPTPSLISLRAMKCHGPVGKSYAYRKLEEKSGPELGYYLIRESETAYNEYYIDLITSLNIQDIDRIHTFLIYKDENDFFFTQDSSHGFPSITQLINHLSKEINMTFHRCIPPSEYDKSDLLLCRKENQDGNSFVTRGDCSCAAQCIPGDAVVLSKNRPELLGQITVVAHGRLRRSCSDFRAVAVKMLKKETKVTHLQEFLSQCDKALFWQHDAIVSTIGMVLANPTALVMEWLPLGTLDKYLQMNENKLRQVDLVEAAYHIARALWHLEELRAVHGKIRCHNILVSSHTDNSFKVKLADPGIIIYSDADIHWIPPEHFNDYSQAAKSTASDVYAFGTTIWEIFSYGAKPLANFTPKEAKEWYQKANSLSLPAGCHKEIEKLILECWMLDQDNRKRPQAIVRDVNQILYEVYNSRRNHSYATIDSSTSPINQEEIIVKPPALPPSRPQKEPALNILRNVFKWQIPTSFPYNSLSTSSTNSSGQSACTFVTDIDRDSPVMQVNSLISICER